MLFFKYDFNAKCSFKDSSDVSWFHVGSCCKLFYFYFAFYDLIMTAHFEFCLEQDAALLWWNTKLNDLKSLFTIKIVPSPTLCTMWPENSMVHLADKWLVIWFWYRFSELSCCFLPSSAWLRLLRGRSWHRCCVSCGIWATCHSSCSLCYLTA